MKKLVAVFVIVMAGLTGCGDVGKRDEPVDITATVTGPDGKPLPKYLIVILQPTGDTLGARLEATVDGQFTGKAAPGKYTYYIAPAKGDTPPRGIPENFLTAQAEHTVEVSSGKSLEIQIR